MPTAEGATADDYLAAAVAVSAEWGLGPVGATILSESENVVCDLELADGRHVVLRLHRPGYNTLPELRSEVRWVEALGAGGLPVPQPLATLDGHHYSTVQVAGQERHVGVIEWVDGRPLTETREDDPAAVMTHYRRIGELAARIRAHGTTWSPPEGFVRRRWDADGLVGPDPLWGRFWEVPAFSKAERALMARARSHLHGLLAAQPTTPAWFGLIHADLHLANLMADGERLTVIDFDDAGFGWYAYELAVALHHVVDEPWYGEARASLVVGYRAHHQLTDDELSLLDAFLCVRSLISVGWLANRPELAVHAHLGAVAARAVRAVEEYRAETGAW